MKCFFWNLRGLANHPTKLALKNLIVKHKPDFCIIAEPWMSVVNLSQRWLHHLNLKIFAVNTRNNLLPNLWCLCASHLSPTILSLDDQQVSFQFDLEGKAFGVTAVYAATCYLRRRELWSAITNIQNQHLIPWSCIGDFNAILGAHEQRSTSSPNIIPMTDFQNWSDSNNLIHLPTRGSEFTWTNGRKGRNNIQRRLDIVIVNTDWINSCSSTSVRTLTKLRSDHYPLLFEFSNHDIQFASNFKFMKMWIEHDDCINIVKQSWNSNVVGCPMYILSRKLKILKENLKTWNKVTFGNIHSQLKLATQKLDDIQADIDRLGYNDHLMEQEKIAQINLENMLNMEEIFWKEKSKVKWHCEGDRNTTYFHRLAKIKNASSLITSMKSGDITLNDPNEVSAHVVNHFSNLFSSNANVSQNDMVQEVIPKLITDRINNMLTLLPSFDEIKNAIFSLNKDSAPGPDGFGAIFFQTYWDIINQDVYKVVMQFFTTGWLLPNFNTNISCLFLRLTMQIQWINTGLLLLRISSSKSYQRL